MLAQFSGFDLEPLTDPFVEDRKSCALCGNPILDQPPGAARFLCVGLDRRLVHFEDCAGGADLSPLFPFRVTYRLAA